MSARLNLLASPVIGKAVKHILGANKVIMESQLPHSTQELVSLRISQINGCAVCIDIHTKEALAGGESATRLHLVAAWRETTVFDEAERAALALAEHGTRLADGGTVPDCVWADAAKHYADDQLTALVLHIALMNTVNRMNVITQQPAKGDYQAGQIAAHQA